MRGRIAHIVEDLADSAINQPDKLNNWGNLVVIADPRGFSVELSHFAQKSLRVKVGDWVERGTVLGLCGNSGYSPQPHIHVQAQLQETPGAATIPFSFVSYLTDGVFHANDLPREKQIVEPLYANKRLDAATNFVLDEEYRYTVQHAGRTHEDLQLKVRMGLDGIFFFDSGRATLAFGRHEGTYYAYRFAGEDPRLLALFLALPRLPLGLRDGIRWHDHVPIGTLAKGVRGMLVGVASSFWPKLAEVRATQTCVGENRVETVIASTKLRRRNTGSVLFDRNKGIAAVSFDGWELRRKDDAN